MCVCVCVEEERCVVLVFPCFANVRAQARMVYVNTCRYAYVCMYVCMYGCVGVCVSMVVMVVV